MGTDARNAYSSFPRLVIWRDMVDSVEMAGLPLQLVEPPGAPGAVARRHRTLALASLALLLLLTAMALAIMLSQGESRSRLRSNLHLRASSSATFIATFLAEQAQQYVRDPQRFLAEGRVPPSSSRLLSEIVAETIPYRQHEVYLVDSHGRLLASSPATEASTLGAASAPLAEAFARSSQGTLAIAGVPSTFTSAAVGSTPTRLLIAIPDSRLYVATGGWAQRVPWIVFALVATFGISLVAVIGRSLADRSRLAALSRELREAAHTDMVTGLPNRRALGERLLQAVIHARRHGEPLSVLMIDLDSFKQINDAHGHDAGDRVLVALAGCLRGVFRADDIFGRWGGDEFVVGMLATDEHGALSAAERLLQAAREASCEALHLPDGVLLSMGIASGTYTTVDDLICKADIALYESKAAGRGRITVSREAPSAVAQGSR
jgi:diguanylate cyclase (GGDEF)-like protein